MCVRRALRGRWCYASTAFPGLVAYWLGVIATAATWAAEAGADVRPVLAWLVVVVLWREGRAELGEVAAAAQACRGLGTWRLAAAVRVASRACWRWDRLCGRVSLREPPPFAAHWELPPGFGLEVLAESAPGFGLDASDARAEWEEACARHGLEAVAC